MVVLVVKAAAVFHNPKWTRNHEFVSFQGCETTL